MISAHSIVLSKIIRQCISYTNIDKLLLVSRLRVSFSVSLPHFHALFGEEAGHLQQILLLQKHFKKQYSGC